MDFVHSMIWAGHPGFEKNVIPRRFFPQRPPFQPRFFFGAREADRLFLFWVFLVSMAGNNGVIT